jgi:nucleoside-diphosphate kinase
MVEQTLAIIKPNAVKKQVSGKILAMWEEHGFTIRALKRVTLTRGQAAGFYAEHVGKPFFDGLLDFMTSGPVILVVLEKDNAILDNRTLMGATNPANADEGTIRKLYADSFTENAVHGSDSPASAAREVSYYFNVFELTA